MPVHAFLTQKIGCSKKLNGIEEIKNCDILQMHTLLRIGLSEKKSFVLQQSLKDDWSKAVKKD
jgi:hypothetical protein